jgi:hypothetical protein
LVSVHVRKKGGLGAPEATDFKGVALMALFNVDEKKWDCDELGGGA